jgi:NADP-dependent 3-hydroxy acid dehydrogenase YdfG
MFSRYMSSIAYLTLAAGSIVAFVESLEGKVVAITGASAGIGAACARRLAGDGARVVLGARREPVLRGLVAEIEADGAAAVACVTDVTRPADLERLVTHAQASFGRLDALVASAGIAVNGPLAGGETADWDVMIDVNLRGVLHGFAAALPGFLAQGSGHFVTVTSTSAIKWVPGQGVYAAAKAGVRAVCEVLRQEVGPTVRCTMVCPGFTATDFIESTRDPQELARLRAMRDAIAMPPEAVADAIAYALGQPASIDVAEIVVRSASQP